MRPRHCKDCNSENLSSIALSKLRRHIRFDKRDIQDTVGILMPMVFHYQNVQINPSFSQRQLVNFKHTFSTPMSGIATYMYSCRLKPLRP